MGVKQQLLKNIALSLVLGGASLSSQADTYEDGLVAYANGEYAAASRFFLDAAEQGNAGAAKAWVPAKMPLHNSNGLSARPNTASLRRNTVLVISMRKAASFHKTTQKR